MLVRQILLLGVLLIPWNVTWAQKVIGVIDGDSFQADFGVFIQQVRMVGIECPEATPSAKARKEAKRLGISLDHYLTVGKQATSYVRKLLPRGTQLRLEYDKDRRDKYGRILAYVFLPNGKLLNEELVAQGYARLFPTKENVLYASRLRSALARAKGQKLGLWKQP